MKSLGSATATATATATAEDPSHFLIPFESPQASEKHGDLRSVGDHTVGGGRVCDRAAGGRASSQAAPRRRRTLERSAWREFPRRAQDGRGAGGLLPASRKQACLVWSLGESPS